MQTSQQRINANASVINIDKLRSEVIAREDRKFKTFESILDMCYQKIINTNKNSNDCCCTFVCPNLVFGLPLFNLDECIMFIMQKLNDKGFDVHLAVPNKLFISWKDPQQKQQQYYPQLTYTTNNTITNTASNNIHNNYNNGYNSGQIMNTQIANLDNNISNFGLYRFPKSETKSSKNGKNSNSTYNQNQNLNMNSMQSNIKSKLDSSKKTYRPIDDYKQTNNTIYDSNDIDLFRNKIDELFS